MLPRILLSAPLVLIFICCCNGYSDCGSKFGSIVSLQIAGCDTLSHKRCNLKRNTNVSMDLTFKSNVDSDTLVADVHGVILNIPMPFNLPNPDACKDSGLNCPIKAGETYTYKTNLPIQESYPRVTVDVNWKLKTDLEDDGKVVVCVEIPSKIV